MFKNKKIKSTVEIYLNRLNDVRFIGQVCFVVIVLLISWSGVKSIQTNYNLQKQITVLSQQNELQQLQNDNLKLQNNYYNSNQYLELSARQNFGLAAPGEKELIVPQQVAMAHTVPVDNTYSTIQQVTSSNQSNISSWLDFFLHKSNGN
jgi:cell division protein FtsB